MNSPRLSRRRSFSVILKDPRVSRGFAFELTVSVQKQIDPQSGMGVNLRDMDAFLETTVMELKTVASGPDLIAGLNRRVREQAKAWSAESATWTLGRGDETWTSDGEFSITGTGRAIWNPELAASKLESDFELTCVWTDPDPNPLQTQPQREKQFSSWLAALQTAFEPKSLFTEDASLKRLEWKSPTDPETRILEKAL